MIIGAVVGWVKAFIQGYRGALSYNTPRQERLAYQGQTEQQIDNAVEDSFPASDPPANY